MNLQVRVRQASRPAHAHARRACRARRPSLGASSHAASGRHERKAQPAYHADRVRAHPLALLRPLLHLLRRYLVDALSQARRKRRRCWPRPWCARALCQTANPILGFGGLRHIPPRTATGLSNPADPARALPTAGPLSARGARAGSLWPLPWCARSRARTANPILGFGGLRHLSPRTAIGLSDPADPARALPTAGPHSARGARAGSLAAAVVRAIPHPHCQPYPRVTHFTASFTRARHRVE